jgi:DNA transposition AAA+ family ATPase
MDQNLLQRFDAHLQKYGISNNKAAAGIGYTPSVLSQWRGGNYRGDIDQVESRIRAWLELQEAREKNETIPYVPLRRTSRIKGVVRIAHEEKFIGLVLGNSGTSKSFALQEYAIENPSTSLLVKCDPTMGLSTLVSILSREIGLDSRGRLSEISDRLVQEVKKRDLVVMLDEADYLTDQVWEWARIAINDKGGAALVFAGLPRVEFRIKSFKADHRQIENRVGIIYRVEDISDAEVDQVLAAVWPEGIDGAVAKIFKQTARGSLHLLERHISNTKRAMHQAQLVGLPTPEIVSDAANLLMK